MTIWIGLIGFLFVFQLAFAVGYAVSGRYGPLVDTELVAQQYAAIGGWTAFR